MSFPVLYKKKIYMYDGDDFNTFMNSKIFQVLMKDIRASKDDKNLSITIHRDLDPIYIFGEFAGMRDNGTTLTINDNPVEGIPAYAIDGLMNYISKYAGVW